MDVTRSHLQISMLSKTALLVPLTTKYAAEFREQLFASLRLFFPQVHLALVLDEEKHEDHETAHLLASELKNASISHEIHFSPETSLAGPIRQQLIIHQADKFVSREYVGFVDTDTVFVTRVVEGHLFSGTKPVIIAVIGMPQNIVWSFMPEVSYKTTANEHFACPRTRHSVSPERSASA